jgi:hypothetical protein
MRAPKLLSIVIGLLVFSSCAERSADVGSRPPSTSPAVLLGDDLVAELGLEPLEGPVISGCRWGVEIRDGVAYCLDSVATSSEEAFVLSSMIQGAEPTAAELELFRLGGDVGSFPNGDEIDAGQRATLERIVELMIEVDAAS